MDPNTTIQPHTCLNSPSLTCLSLAFICDGKLPWNEIIHRTYYILCLLGKHLPWCFKIKTYQYLDYCYFENLKHNSIQIKVTGLHTNQNIKIMVTQIHTHSTHLYICHGLLDLLTSDHPTDDHPSACQPLSPLMCSANCLDNTWYHQMSLIVMSHPPHAVSHLNSHIKVIPLI